MATELFCLGGTKMHESNPIVKPKERVQTANLATKASKHERDNFIKHNNNYLTEGYNPLQTHERPAIASLKHN